VNIIPFLVRLGCIAVLAGAAAAAIRFLVIEPPEIGYFCDSLQAAWWCPVRTGTISLLHAGLLGFISGACGVAAIAGGGRWLSAAAVATGVAGLLLYSPELSSGGLLLGVLRGVRL
jgi:hypothetical protein